MHCCRELGFCELGRDRCHLDDGCRRKVRLALAFLHPEILGLEVTYTCKESTIGLCSSQESGGLQPLDPLRPGLFLARNTAPGGLRPGADARWAVAAPLWWR